MLGQIVLNAAGCLTNLCGHHASLLELGVLLALYDGAEVLLKPVFGSLSDRVGPRPVLLGGLVGFAIASTGFVVAGQPGWLGIARLAQGASAAAFSPAAAALVAGDLVLDPFIGSGTTGLVALKQKRRFVGVELNPSYLQIAEDRLNGDLIR